MVPAIKYSEIDRQPVSFPVKTLDERVLEALGRKGLSTTLPYRSIMDPKLGTVALEQVAASLASLIKRAVRKFADGFQLSDLTFIPESLGDVMTIAKNIPASIKEAGDLDVEEITKIFGIVLAEAVAVYAAFKNKPGSIK